MGSLKDMSESKLSYIVELCYYPFKFLSVKLLPSRTNVLTYRLLRNGHFNLKVVVYDMADIMSRWRHNGPDSVSNHQPHYCLLNRLFRRRSKETSKLRVTGLCAGSSPGPVNSPHKWPITRKMFPFDDVIMNVLKPGQECMMKLSKFINHMLHVWKFMDRCNIA